MRRRAALLLVVLALLAVAFYVPLGRVISEGLRSDGAWSARPLASILGDPYYVGIIGFTLKQAGLSTLVALLIGLPGALLLGRFRFPGRGVARSLTAVPFVLPAITVALGFVLFWGRGGALNHALMSWFGLARPPVRVLYSMWGIVLAHAFYNAPIVMRLVSSVWETIDPELDEAAAALGRGPIRRLLTVDAPLVLPAVLSASALVFVLCFLSFPIVLALGGARFTTIEVEIYTLVRTLLDPERGGALILVEGLLSLCLTYAYLQAEAMAAVPVSGRRRRPLRSLFARPFDLGRIALCVYGVLALGFFAGPIGAIVVDSVRSQGAWSLGNYRYLLTAGYSPLLGASPLRTVATSLLVAGVSTAAAVPLGTAVAAISVRSRRRGRRVLEALLMIPLGLSSVAVGYAVLRGLGGAVSRVGGAWVPISIAHAILNYPFVVRVMRPVLGSVDPSVIDAARTLGAGPARRLLTVELPAVWKGVAAAGVFAFALSIGEMSAAIVLMRPGTATLPLAVHSLLASRQFGAASAMAVVLIAVTAGCFLMLDRLGALTLEARWRR